MYTTDANAFKDAMDRLGVVFSKEISDHQRAAYWDALKDLDIRVVRDLAQKHERFGKFFPKPVELRPKGDKVPVDSSGDASNQEADRRAIEGLEELRRLMGDAVWLQEVRKRHLGRIEAQHGTDSERYRTLYRRWEDRLARDGLCAEAA